MWAPFGRKKQLPGLTSLKKNSSWSCTKMHTGLWYTENGLFSEWWWGFAWYISRRRICWSPKYLDLNNFFQVDHFKVRGAPKYFTVQKASSFYFLIVLNSSNHEHLSPLNNCCHLSAGRKWAELLRFCSDPVALPPTGNTDTASTSAVTSTFWMPSSSYNGHNRDKRVGVSSLPAAVIGIRTWLLWMDSVYV